MYESKRVYSISFGFGTMIGFHCDSHVQAHIIQQQTVAMATEVQVRGPSRESFVLKYCDKPNARITPTTKKIMVPNHSGSIVPVSRQGTLTHSLIVFLFEKKKNQTSILPEC